MRPSARRHHHVEHDQVGIELLRQSQALRAIVSLVQLVTLRLQVHEHDLTYARLVIHDQYLLTSAAHRPLRSLPYATSDLRPTVST